VLWAHNFVSIATSTIPNIIQSLPFGRKFPVYKFRTMVQNADRVLQDYLDKYPELKVEWLATHKLKQDPRVTRLGALLRMEFR
jgi:lipopolysaccharide/colanic/teichoic acid biosynthesis glycosyltransferase